MTNILENANRYESWMWPAHERFFGLSMTGWPDAPHGLA